MLASRRSCGKQLIVLSVAASVSHDESNWSITMTRCGGFPVSVERSRVAEPHRSRRYSLLVQHGVRLGDHTLIQGDAVAGRPFLVSTSNCLGQSWHLS